MNKNPEFSSAERDVLYCLFAKGATWDGNVPSKSGRDALIERGLAYRHDGWAILTPEGLRMACSLGYDTRKGY